LLPDRLVNQLSEDDLKNIFLHELSHYKRKDILINWLAVIANIGHWFNPVIWYSLAKMREDCELACDASTLSLLSPEEYRSYGLSVINLVTISQSSLLPGTTGFFCDKRNNNIKRRIEMIKFFKKPAAKWTWLPAAIFIFLGLLGFMNITSNSQSLSEIKAEKQAAAERQTSETETSFDYQKYLSFTPLHPSYTAGYELRDSRISSLQSDSLGYTSNSYLAIYENTYGNVAFTIREARPNEIPLSDSAQLTKSQIQIGDLPATLLTFDKDGYAIIQFTKNDVEYTVNNVPEVPDGGVSPDELKKICEGIVVPVNTPPADIRIFKEGQNASEGLNFKTLQPDDLVIPQGYTLDTVTSWTFIEGSEETEKFSLDYRKGNSFLRITEIKGDQPNVFSIAAVMGEKPYTEDVIPETDCDTKQIENVTVKLRKTYNSQFTAALFSLPDKGLNFRIESPDLPESEVEKVVTSILQAALN
jgi:hypothetical protein